MTVASSSFDLGGRVVVVTGGAGRLGSSFSRALISAGARVAIVDTVEPGANPGSDEARIRFYRADITSHAALVEAREAIEAEWGAPFGLVNNAAIDSPPDAPASENGPFEDYPESAFDRVMSVNVKGAFLCAQVFGAAMAAAGRGSIVNIGSIYGILSPDQALYQYRREHGETFFKPVAYSVSKSALMNLTRYLAVYWGSKGG